MDATTLSLTLHTLRERYLAHADRHYRRRSGDPTREADNMKFALDRFVAFAGDTSLGAKINRHQVRAWVDQLASEELTRCYVNQCLSRVRRWVRWCADWDLIPFSVTEDLRLVRPLMPFRSKAKESVKLTPPRLADIEKVIGMLPSNARDVLHLVKLTGARPSEILALTHGEVVIDDNPRLVIGQHKTAHFGHRRIIPLSPAAVAIVHCRWCPLLPADRLFESRSRCGHYTIGCFRSAIRRACKRAGVPVFTPYAVRHAVARWVRQHRGLDAAQSLLGHSSARTTEIYAPMTAGDQRTLDAARSATEVL
jgi:integrase